MELDGPFRDISNFIDDTVPGSMCICLQLASTHNATAMNRDVLHIHLRDRHGILRFCEKDFLLIIKAIALRHTLSDICSIEPSHDEVAGVGL